MTSAPFNSNQYGLALHTVSPDLGLAISNFSGDSRSQVWELGRELSTHLHVYLAEFLKPQTWKDLTWIAVARGPGGFTGTRIGVVAARTLAQQLEIPLFAISTLATIAWAEQPNLPQQCAIAVQMRAQREELFCAIYQPSPDGMQLKVLVPDTVMTPEAWQQTVTRQRQPYHLVKVEGGLGSSVCSLLDLAHCAWQQGKRPHWSGALPFYGQHPVDGGMMG
ncbi:tRNA (adenosine(37)-N6)-threonylcarbamoyltransferase complex dimerization subunit type 1 TsaB [Leptothermofonsia sp. ETS-13]|uniref:tRNA (adenosine(37)-N6)-threonylcarbamoyltransferase complex dimerization subunit type 1 TsaB n=1 Tax=Leptothermofonsia sp. ETS-13 TaxID=3035696 RepID=UPI003B9ED923